MSEPTIIINGHLLSEILTLDVRQAVARHAAELVSSAPVHDVGLAAAKLDRLREITRIMETEE